MGVLAAWFLEVNGHMIVLRQTDINVGLHFNWELNYVEVLACYAKKLHLFLKSRSL